jgi:hypothetical protein
MGASTEHSATAVRRQRDQGHLVFPGDSRMAVRCRQFDWSGTPLGDESRWPVSLRTLTSTLLPQDHINQIYADNRLVQHFLHRAADDKTAKITVNPSTTFRWVTNGAKGPGGRVVKLEAVRVGGRWITSRAALVGQRI